MEKENNKCSRSVFSQFLGSTNQNTKWSIGCCIWRNCLRGASCSCFSSVVCSPETRLVSHFNYTLTILIYHSSPPINHTELTWANFGVVLRYWETPVCEWWITTWTISDWADNYWDHLITANVTTQFDNTFQYLCIRHICAFAWICVVCVLGPHSRCVSPRHFRPDSRRPRHTSTPPARSESCGTGTHRVYTAAAPKHRRMFLMGNSGEAKSTRDFPWSMCVRGNIGTAVMAHKTC